MLALSSSAEYFQCPVWPSITMSLTYFWAGLKQLLKLKKGAKKRNGNLGYEEATKTLTIKWASSRCPTPAGPVSAPPSPSPFLFAAAGLQPHFQVVWFSHLGVVLHQLNDPWLYAAWLCSTDVSDYSFYKSKFKYRCTWTQWKFTLPPRLAPFLGFLFLLCQGGSQRWRLVLPHIHRTSHPSGGNGPSRTSPMTPDSVIPNTGNPLTSDP